jgi:uncharacterized membrane protein YedE/YeeE
LLIRSVFIGLTLGALAVSAGVRFALLLGLGLLIGYSLERFGFGFAGPWRRLIVKREADGVCAQLVAIGLTALFIQPLIASSSGLMGAIAPVSLTMVFGAALFGFAMQIVLGCGSGTLVNAGTGNLIAMTALPLFCIGSFLGSLLMPIAIDLTPHVSINLSETFGLVGGLVVTLGGLVLVGWCATRGAHGPIWNQQLIVAGAVLAILAALHVLVAGQPWGVVYGLGLWVAKAAAALGWQPETSAFWSHPINASALANSILTDTTSLTSLGLVGGAACASWRVAHSQRLVPPVAVWFFAVIALAGLVLGVSSRLAFGCNVGALFSGIASGSLHGWAWLVAGFIGSIYGVRAREWLWLRAQGARA